MVGRRWCFTAVLLVVLSAAPSTAVAQAQWDPAATISAYSAALNAHDLQSALALFDENGSATDTSGHHFEGQAGLTEFLLASGFASPTARVSTVSLIVVANRAIWTYSCSCATASTDARLVMNHDKISVFTEMPFRAAQRPSTSPAGVPWEVRLGLLVVVLVSSVLFLLHRGDSTPLPRRASQGTLLAALHSWRWGGLVGPR